MTKHKKKTEIEISDEILQKNLPKAAEVLISLLESKDTLVRAQAAAYIVERVTGRPLLIIPISNKKKLH
jgi:HEAT repeat protein